MSAQVLFSDFDSILEEGKKWLAKMLIKIFEDSDVKKLIGIDYSESTWTKYDRTKRFTQEFIVWNHKSDDI